MPLEQAFNLLNSQGAIFSWNKLPLLTLGPCRSGLISKGMVYSSSYGDTAFTVPLFDQYMKRAMRFAAWNEED